MENSKDTRARLEDVITYQPEKYLTDEEVALISSTFKGNQKLLNAVRKVLIPTIYDAQLPIEQFGADAFGAGRDWAAIPADEAKILFVAREDAIKFIAGGLIKLNTIAHMPAETPADAQARKEKDSTR